MLVLAMAGALVLLGRLLRLPWGGIWAMLGVLWGAVMLAHLVLPAGHPLPRATGGDWRVWAVVGGLAALALAYRAALVALRRRARPVARRAPAAANTLSETELDRYARHIILREIGGPGQRRLRAARVLVVGAGGLGSPALLYLAAAGVGTIGVIDDDTVANSNLQRQVIHADDRIGLPKVFSAEASLRALNPFVDIRPYNRRLTADLAPGLFADYDLILDGSDNFDTRALANAAAVAAGKPLIAGAVSQWEGQLTLYDPARGAPCMACLFPEPPAPGLAPACAEAGVMAALPGIVGAMMAAEAIKEITGAGQSLRGRLILHDALWGESRQIAVKPRPGCPVCGGGAPSVTV